MAAMKPLEYGRSDSASPERKLPDKYVRCSFCTDGNGPNSIRDRATGKPVPFEIVAKEGLLDTMESHGMCDPCADGFKRLRDQRLKEKGLQLEDIRKE